MTTFPASYPSPSRWRRTHSTGCEDEPHSFRRADAQGDGRALVDHIGIRHASSYEALFKRFAHDGFEHATGTAAASGGGGEGEFHAVLLRSIAQHITSSLRVVATTAILRLALLSPHTRSKIALSTGL